MEMYKQSEFRCEAAVSCFPITARQSLYSHSIERRVLLDLTIRKNRSPLSSRSYSHKSSPAWIQESPEVKICRIFPVNYSDCI